MMNTTSALKARFYHVLAVCILHTSTKPCKNRRAQCFAHAGFIFKVITRTKKQYVLNAAF